MFFAHPSKQFRLFIKVVFSKQFKYNSETLNCLSLGVTCLAVLPHQLWFRREKKSFTCG